MTTHSSPHPDDREVDQDRPTIQVDFYGIKVGVSPSDSGHSTPDTWTDVAVAINSHLKNIAVSVFGLFDDVIRGSRNLVRGITGIPTAVRGTIETAHNHADFEEWSKQQEIQRGVYTGPKPENAAMDLESLLQSFKGNGAQVSVFQLPDGRWCIGLVAPEFTPTLPDLVEEALDSDDDGFDDDDFDDDDDDFDDDDDDDFDDFDDDDEYEVDELDDDDDDELDDDDDDDDY